MRYTCPNRTISPPRLNTCAACVTRSSPGLAASPHLSRWARAEVRLSTRVNICSLIYSTPLSPLLFGSYRSWCYIIDIFILSCTPKLIYPRFAVSYLFTLSVVWVMIEITYHDMPSLHFSKQEEVDVFAALSDKRKTGTPMRLRYLTPWFCRGFSLPTSVRNQGLRSLRRFTRTHCLDGKMNLVRIRFELSIDMELIINIFVFFRSARVPSWQVKLSVRLRVVMDPMEGKSVRVGIYFTAKGKPFTVFSWTRGISFVLSQSLSRLTHYTLLFNSPL